ncbi:hypothetical protein PHLCEN_2v4022 [Hermanssonia centrifuga]|uniref:Uncharacterized protein n=1 Tax=Hermanssonia centrifuga TaxID=98765 RepID=A0A2R6Q5J8_9APHY|nr:hypothetical protein PHLCEN_2v4022 [Hermanssonia centrifuga]
MTYDLTCGPVCKSLATDDALLLVLNDFYEDPGKPAQSFDPETPSLSGSGIPHL